MKKGRQIHPINVTVGYTGIQNGEQVWNDVYGLILASAIKKLAEELRREDKPVDGSLLNNKVQ